MMRARFGERSSGVGGGSDMLSIALLLAFGIDDSCVAEKEDGTHVGNDEIDRFPLYSCVACVFFGVRFRTDGGGLSHEFTCLAKSFSAQRICLTQQA